MKYLLPTLLVLVGSSASAEVLKFKFTLAAGAYDRQNVPVQVPIQLSSLPPAAWARIQGPGGKSWPAQITRPALATKTKAAEIVFILPQAKRGETLELTAEVQSEGAPAEPSFKWIDTSGQHTDLAFDERPVLRYMYAALDESTKETHSATFKPYHHVYDPTGKTLLTKGPGGLFPHHRGVFYGFNRITYDNGKKADVWHCNNGEYQSHEQFVSSEAGPVLGRHVCRIAWRGQDGKVFAEELRELSAYNTPGGTLIEFASQLESKVGVVHLDGDPQHAGFQFRATQEVPDKTAKLTYYLRPDGKGEPGKFRNWDDKGRDPKTVNLPWNALCFVVNDQRYTCCYLDRPENPKEARYSERDYGRFGSYFEFDLTSNKLLDVNYRLWLQAGEMTGEQVQRLADDFVQPVKVSQK